MIPDDTTALRLLRLTRYGRPHECWPWQGSLTPTGYGSGWKDGTKTTLQRVVYRAWVGPIPDGYQIDHICHTVDLSCPGGPTCPHRACANPNHLRAVTERENILCGRARSAQYAKATHCIHNHPLSGDNLRVEKRTGKRTCKTCTARRVRECKARKKENV